MSSPGGVWAKVYPDSMVLGNGRNLLYNGAMQVHQRGTSKTGITASGYYTADRWQALVSSLGTWTQSVENDAPTGSGFGKSLKMLCTTAKPSPAADDYCWFLQQLEGQDVQRIAKGTSSAQQLALSFWVKSNATGTYVVYVHDGDNDRMTSFAYTISASATWEKKTIVIPADATGAFDNDNASSLQIYWGLAAGSKWTSGALQSAWTATVNGNLFAGQTNLAAAVDNYWQVTGVQLEVGETATSFEHKKFGAELAECQRYYQKSYHYADSPGTPDGRGYVVVAGMANTNTQTGNHYVSVRFPSRMRATPTVVAYDAGSGAAGVISYAKPMLAATTAPVSMQNLSDSQASIFTTNASGLTPGDAVELLFHYTADAEL